MTGASVRERNPVNRPLSQLIYARMQQGSGSPRIITLHKHRQYGKDVVDFALAADPDARIIGLQSYKGVYVGREIVGYTWFIGPFDRPSPLFYGDGLAEIEKFLWDELQRQEPGVAELPFLIGVEQGAIMALGAAAAVPDLISGVIAIDGSFPLVPGWEPPLAPLDGLPILIVDREGLSRPEVDDVLTGDAMVERFRTWGGEVTRAVVAEEGIPADILKTWMQSRTPRFHTPGS
jgi:pimeloyl-ACP methyl ester carboxylesterase